MTKKIKNTVLATQTVKPNLNNIKCYGCHKVKALIEYSNSQLNKFTLNNKAILCKSCNPIAPRYIKCDGCIRHLPLDQFSKSQRRNAKDFIRCMDCMKRNLDSDSSQEEFE